jgi:hypothetical protein
MKTIEKTNGDVEKSETIVTKYSEEQLEEMKVSLTAQVTKWQAELDEVNTMLALFD